LFQKFELFHPFEFHMRKKAVSPPHLAFQNYNFGCYCETWSLTLPEEHRLGVSDNGVLTKLFGMVQAA
jgi:hypothetical protein